VKYRVTISREYHVDSLSEEDALEDAFELEHMGHVEVAPVVNIDRPEAHVDVFNTGD
jgi:hypothetical protein